MHARRKSHDGQFARRGDVDASGNHVETDTLEEDIPHAGYNTRGIRFSCGTFFPQNFRH